MNLYESMVKRCRIVWAFGMAPDQSSGFQRLTCQHKGIYADDCIHSRVDAHRCYIVCTNDKDLKRRIRKAALSTMKCLCFTWDAPCLNMLRFCLRALQQVPGVPIMSVARGMFKVERVPEQIDKVPLKRGPQNHIYIYL